MNILDYIILGLLAVSLVIGLIKGFIKQLLTILGVFVVATVTATVAPYVQSWFTSFIPNDNARTIVAMIVSALIVIIVYSIVALLLRAILTKIKILKVIDVILGGLTGIAVVYMIFAVVFALLLSTGENFLVATKGALGETFQNSWFGTHIYSNNFFGDWIIKGIAEKILGGLQAG